eukprot:13811089-Ditylum_brightwellii.AAC.1
MSLVTESHNRDVAFFASRPCREGPHNLPLHLSPVQNHTSFLHELTFAALIAYLAGVIGSSSAIVTC